MAVSRPLNRFSITDVLALLQSSGHALSLGEISDHLGAVLASGRYMGGRRRDLPEYLNIRRPHLLWALLEDLQSIGIIEKVAGDERHLEDHRWRLNEGWSRGENVAFERHGNNGDRGRAAPPPPQPPVPPPRPPGDSPGDGPGDDDGGGDGRSGLREVLAHPYLLAVSAPDLDDAIDRALMVLS